MLSDPNISILGQDPDRAHRINANSFQQQAITSINGFQYAGFYTDVPHQKGACYANISRRQSTSGVNDWETVTFEDYSQVVDDGHNTISLGVCRGDGTVHLGFDHHCDRLRFRISEIGLVTEGKWEKSRFRETQDFLPGIEHNNLMDEVTYPRFVNVGDDLLLTFRIGQAGLGSDILFHYSSTTHQYTYIGQHLTGISNSPYVNGIDYRLSRLHISWCYRNFVPIPASEGREAHKQQAGPNGPENNFDLNYAYSDDLGLTWRSSEGGILACLKPPKKGNEEESREGGEGGSSGGEETTINPGAEGARVFEIPMGSGILNQESQCADGEGGFWVLNRENRTGEEKWVVYYRSASGKWTIMEIDAESPPTEIGNRGAICVSRANDAILVLPGNTDENLRLMRMRISEKEEWEWETVWRGEGFDGEPGVDVGRLEVSDALSVFTRRVDRGGERSVVVLDFDLLAEK